MCEIDILLLSKRNQHPCCHTLTLLNLFPPDINNFWDYALHPCWHVLMWINILTTFDLKSTKFSLYMLHESNFLLFSKWNVSPCSHGAMINRGETFTYKKGLPWFIITKNRLGLSWQRPRFGLSEGPVRSFHQKWTLSKALQILHAVLFRHGYKQCPVQ